MIKKILLGLLAILVIIQFIRPERNDSNDNTYHISTQYAYPSEVAGILKVACDDCHTNITKYPWYSNIQPVGWWLNDHVEHGKKHLNFSEFTNRRIAVQNHKLEEVIEMIEEDEMPLDSYTMMGLHAEANLTDAQKQTIINWAKDLMADISANYPADSLVLRRKKK